MIKCRYKRKDYDHCRRPVPESHTPPTWAIIESSGICGTSTVLIYYLNFIARQILCVKCPKCLKIQNWRPVHAVWSSSFISFRSGARLSSLLLTSVVWHEQRPGCQAVSQATWCTLASSRHQSMRRYYPPTT